MNGGTASVWEPGLLTSTDDAVSLIAWAQQGQPCFRLQVQDLALSLAEAAAMLASHIETGLHDPTNEFFEGTDAAMRVVLRTDGVWEDGRGWLNAPDDYKPTPIRTLAVAAVEFLRPGPQPPS